MKTSILIRVSFFLNIMVVSMGMIAGCRYLFATQLLKYHLDAMSISAWALVDAGHHAMLLTFLRVAGLGMTTASTAMGILLFGAFRRGENWSRWGILGIFLIHFGPLQINMIGLAANTPASPPYLLNTAAIVMAVTAFFLSRDLAGKEAGRGLAA
ncbi:MAG: hypothetical protein GY737_24400 [Desulfobacteraceae bacterium]|nr:hypothetical protein [Desulfobacteraceae bacterium]